MVARFLVDKGGAGLVKAATNGNVTALHLACENGHVDVARLLLDKGGEGLVRAVDAKTFTALHYACQGGHLKVARLLVDRGADLRAKVQGRFTPIDVASQCGHPSVAVMLKNALKGSDQMAALDAFFDGRVSAPRCSNRQQQEMYLKARTRRGLAWSARLITLPGIRLAKFAERWRTMAMVMGGFPYKLNTHIKTIKDKRKE